MPQQQDWLADFVEFNQQGEIPEKFIYWVGVSTIAGALRRKVWIEQGIFQWTPNFYLILVGPPGGPKKSTAIGMGMKFLRRLPDIQFGPQIVTWQQLITKMANSKQVFETSDGRFEASCLTVEVSEFGTFFDPTNRDLVDSLTDLWDSKLGVIRKETKTSGCDEITNPWLNIMAGTTPGWFADNFSTKLIRSGFASRPIFLYEETPTKRIAYPSRNKPSCSVDSAMEESLMDRLYEISNYSGEYILTEEAFQYGEAWYETFKDEQARLGSSLEAGFYERKQTHLHKLAMVISASRGHFPIIDADDLREANYRLSTLDEDVRYIFGLVGQTKLTQASGEFLDILKHKGTMTKYEVYKSKFFRTLTYAEFDIILKSAIACGNVIQEGPSTNPIFTYTNENQS